MTCAYSELFVNDAMECLGEAFEYAIHKLHLRGQEFWDMFALGIVGEAFSRGDVKYLSGMSGVELAESVLRDVSIVIETKDYDLRIDYPAEYWCGWALAYYQWHSGKSFRQIRSKISFENIEKLYPVLHEAGEDKLTEVLDRFFEGNSTKLAKARDMAGLSQNELAKASGVSLRSIQMYEQKQNDINKAQYNRLCAIAQALRCKINDIVE